MLKKLLFVGVLFVAFALGVLSFRQYDQYKTQQNSVEQVESDLAEDTPSIVEEPTVDEVVESSPEELDAEQERIKSGCEVALDNYDQLSEADKVYIQAPLCDLEVIE